MIDFEIDGDDVIFTYEPEFDGGRERVMEELKAHRRVTIAKVFHFRAQDVIEHGALPEVEASGFGFRFGVRREGYIHVEGRILGIPNSVLLADADIDLSKKLFVAVRDTSIFRRLAQLYAQDQPIVIGGKRADAIPAQTYRDLLRRFPNTTELNRYAQARVATVLGDHIDPLRDARERYEIYLNRRPTLARASLEQRELVQADFEKFTFIRDTIAQWLSAETHRSEKEWQAMILNFLLLIFPKYVAVLSNVTIADFYSKPGTKKARYIDLALVDAGGNLDVIEVKKPFDDALVGKGLYRGNSVPARELAGSIMQAEKYLFHLSKWGVAGEAKLTKDRGAELPNGLEIRITNPKAMVIIGRDTRPDGKPALSAAQRFDLEVIKRKYANMMDIMTYDDLLRRLDNILASLQRRGAQAVP